MNRDFDLRDPAKLWENEQEGCVPAGKRIYGAWWFFFFPLSGVKNYSLPFFVRGDDIDFSYANDFHVASLNGVSCWQQDFKTKESPLTAYLFLRSHLVHHMTLPQLKCSFGILWKILWGHFRRYNASYFYGTAAAVNLAMSHVLKGPKFFEDNIEPTEVLRKIKEISQCEKTEPLTEEEFESLVPADSTIRLRGLPAALRRWSMNGHLLPPWCVRDTPEAMICKKDAPRAKLAYLRSQVTVVDSQSRTKTVLRRSPVRFFRNLAGFLLLSARLALALPFLARRYRKAAHRMRTREFWEQALEGGRGSDSMGRNADSISGTANCAGTGQTHLGSAHNALDDISINFSNTAAVPKDRIADPKTGSVCGITAEGDTTREVATVTGEISDTGRCPTVHAGKTA